MLRATYTCALFGWKIEKAQTMGKMSTYWGLSREPTSPAHQPHQDAQQHMFKSTLTLISSNSSFMIISEAKSSLNPPPRATVKDR